MWQQLLKKIWEKLSSPTKPLLAGHMRVAVGGALPTSQLPPPPPMPPLASPPLPPQPPVHKKPTPPFLERQAANPHLRPLVRATSVPPPTTPRAPRVAKTYAAAAAAAVAGLTQQWITFRRKKAPKAIQKRLAKPAIDLRRFELAQDRAGHNPLKGEVEI